MRGSSERPRSGSAHPPDLRRRKLVARHPVSAGLPDAAVRPWPRALTHCGARGWEEGSTRLAQDVGPDLFTEILERQNAILRDAIRRHSGTERGTQGDCRRCHDADRQPVDDVVNPPPGGKFRGMASTLQRASAGRLIVGLRRESEPPQPRRRASHSEILVDHAG